MTTAADLRRIRSIAERAVRANLAPAAVVQGEAERAFMLSHSWLVWESIAELRSGKPVSQTTTAKRTTVTVDSDRTVVEVVDDDPAPQYAKPGDDDGEPCDPTDPADDCDEDVVDDD